MKRGGRVERGDRVERSVRMERGVRIVRGDRMEKGVRMVRGDRMERGGRMESGVRVERGGRMEKGVLMEKSVRTERGGRMKRGGHTEGAARVWLTYAANFTATPLLLFLFLLVCSVTVSMCSEECPLVSEGRLNDCLPYLNISQYDNDQLSQSCREGELDRGPQCMQRVIDQCEHMGAFPQEMEQLKQQLRTVRNKFEHICAEFQKLHASASSATSGSRSSHVTYWSRDTMAALLLVVSVSRSVLS